MVRVRYLGLADARAAVRELRPVIWTLRGWRDRYAPASPECRAIIAATTALDAMSERLIGEPVLGPVAFAMQPRPTPPPPSPPDLPPPPLSPLETDG